MVSFVFVSSLCWACFHDVFIPLTLLSRAFYRDNPVPVGGKMDVLEFESWFVCCVIFLFVWEMASGYIIA